MSLQEDALVGEDASVGSSPLDNPFSRQQFRHAPLPWGTRVSIFGRFILTWSEQGVYGSQGGSDCTSVEQLGRSGVILTWVALSSANAPWPLAGSGPQSRLLDITNFEDMSLCAAALALNRQKRKTKAISALSTKIVH